MTTILAWHFVSKDRVLQYGSGLTVEPGYVYTEDEGPIVLCQNGMHASRTVWQALSYAPGPVLCRVKVWGEVKEDSDKLVGRHREVIAMYDIEKELRLWACWCVRQVWHLLTDERSRRAVEVAEAFSRGEATRDQLATAGDAAWIAAKEAVGPTSAAAAKAARAAASAAIGAFASATDWAAWATWNACAAARDAARDASWAIAWDTAGSWAIARAAQIEELDARVAAILNEIPK